MKADDELNDRDNLSTTKKGKEEDKLRRLTTMKDGGNKDAKLRQVPKSARGKDEEGSPSEERRESKSERRRESESDKMRRILGEQGAIKKKTKMGRTVSHSRKGRR